MINLKMLCIIIDEGFDKKVNNILNKFNIKAKTVSNASGTASQSILNYFGLEETKKELFFAIIPDYLSGKILSKINNEFEIQKEGTGVAFTMPISSSNKFLVDNFKQDAEGNEMFMNESEKKYHLVITIVLEGYLEIVMDAAKKAGCAGGTVIKGRGLGNVMPAKILGFNIEQEKDIVFNVVQEKDKKRVMEEISNAVGIKTPGKGICISLPIEDTIGFERYE